MMAHQILSNITRFATAGFLGLFVIVASVLALGGWHSEGVPGSHVLTTQSVDVSLESVPAQGFNYLQADAPEEAEHYLHTCHSGGGFCGQVFVLVKLPETHQACKSSSYESYFNHYQFLTLFDMDRPPKPLGLAA